MVWIRFGPNPDISLHAFIPFSRNANNKDDMVGYTEAISFAIFIEIPGI
jgi:hypothetical protein